MISYFTTRSVRVFGLLCVMLMLSIGSDANEPAGSTVVVIGSVNIERLNGALVGLQANDDIYLSERIKTGPDGLAKVLLRDDSMLKISPESDVTITDMIAGPGSDGESSVELLKGRLRSVIGNKISSGAQYTIKTPVAVAGVRGTDFEVVHMLVDGKWTSALRCFDGSVEFSSANKKVLILPNNYSLVQQGGEVSQPKTIAPNGSLIDVLLNKQPSSQSNNQSTAPSQLDAPLDDIQIINSLLGIEQITVETVDVIIKKIEAEPVVVIAPVALPQQQYSLPQVEVFSAPSRPQADIDLNIDIPIPK